MKLLLKSPLSEKRLGHIYEGEISQSKKNGELQYGGGHGHPGLPGKSAFPESWDKAKIAEVAKQIANDSNLERHSGGMANGRERFVVEGCAESVRVRVIVKPSGEGIITAFPIPDTK